MKNEFLRGIIDKKIEFSKQIKWNSPNKNVFLASDENQILEAMKLRYLVSEYEGYLTWDKEKKFHCLIVKRNPRAV